MQVQLLGRKDPLEKEMAAHSSVLAWEIPWTEKPGRLPWGGRRVRYNLETKQQQQHYKKQNSNSGQKTNLNTALISPLYISPLFLRLYLLNIITACILHLFILLPHNW